MFILILSIVTGTLNILFPIYIGEYIDNFSVSNLSLQFLLVATFFLLVSSVTNGFSQWFFSKICEEIIFDNRLIAWKSILNGNLSDVRKFTSGKLASYIVNEIDRISAFYTEEIPSFISNMVFIVGYIFLLTAYNKLFLIVLFLLLIVTASCVIPAKNKMGTYSSFLINEITSIMDYFIDVVNNIDIVKVYDRVEQEELEGESKFFQIKKYSLKEAKIYAWLDPAVTFIISLSIVFIFFFGINLVNNDSLKLGELVTIILLTLQIIEPLKDTIELLVKLGSIKESIKIVKTLHSLSENIKDKNKIRPQKKNILTLKNVYYKEKNYMILRDIGLKLKTGHVYKLIGDSGSGKTTLLRIIGGLISPIEGEVSFNNQNILNTDYFNYVSYLPQELKLFRKSIKKNIEYNRKPKIQAVQFDFIINNLNKSIEQISGGQKQQVGITRTLDCDSDIILLDEPSSNLDIHLEKKILHILDSIKSEKIIVYSTHRIELLEDDDYVFFIRNGTIKCQGRHIQLKNEDIEYRKFVAN